MQKESLIIFFVLIAVLVSCEDTPKSNCPKSSVTFVAEKEYVILQVRDEILDGKKTQIAAIQLHKVKRDTFITFWEIATTICKNNDFVAADFFMQQDYGKCLRKEKFKWNEDKLIKKTGSFQRNCR